MSNFTTLIPVPPAASINTGHSPCPTAYLVRQYGAPRKYLSDKCQAVTSAFWKGRMITASVGPFSLTGHRLAVEHMRKSLAKVKARNPELYAALKTAGMLCCREVRGSTVLSNHGLGMAVDFEFLDPDGRAVLGARGDNKVLTGELELYKILKEDGWYWMAEARVEDGMHFEPCGELVMQWIRAGTF